VSAGRSTQDKVGATETPANEPAQRLAEQFGRALRDLRTSVRPEELGLPDDQRRTPGIRREELATLAAVSPEYVKRLEQNRAHPSPQVIRALVGALRLNHAQHEHLSRLAGFTPICGETVPRQTTAGVERFVARMSQTPLAVFDAAWTLIAWNELWQVLLSSMTEAEGRERNLVWRRFNGLSSAVISSPEHDQRFEAALVADLRTVAIRYPSDPFVADLVTDLVAISTRFAALWERGEVARHESTKETLSHPLVGELTVDCDVFMVDGADVRVIVYTVEPGSADADKLERIARLTNIVRS
jgi:transcriptional regulator with XRE-family HTH domain